MLDAPKLSSFPFFSELSPAGQSQLRAATSHVLLAPQTKVIQRGDEVGGVYLVEAGALRVYYVSAEGREGTLYWVDAGSPAFWHSTACSRGSLIRLGSRRTKSKPESSLFRVKFIAGSTSWNLRFRNSPLKL